MTELCEIMTRHGSDKGSGWHNYTQFYYNLFQPIRNNKMRVFELGLGTNNINLPCNMGANGIPGASLRGWAVFFPNSEIFGADIDKCILFEDDRIMTFYCDQTNVNDIRQLWENKDLKSGFDIIIEDGLHEIDANVCFFENSIHKLNKNGYYIIEDIISYNLEQMSKQCEIWNTKYDNIEASLIQIENPNNKIDNNIVLIKKKN